MITIQQRDCPTFDVRKRWSEISSCWQFPSCVRRRMVCRLTIDLVSPVPCSGVAPPLCPQDRGSRTLFSKPAGISGCRVRIRASIGLSGRRGDLSLSLSLSLSLYSLLALVSGAFSQRCWFVDFDGSRRKARSTCGARLA